MNEIEYEHLHFANNMPIRVASLYKDLYAAMSEGRNSGLDDPCMRELELSVRTNGPQIEVLKGDGRWRSSQLLLRSDNPHLSSTTALAVQITLDKDAVLKLLSAMRAARGSGDFVGLQYYNAILALPKVVELGQEVSSSVGMLVSPIPPMHRPIATFMFAHEDKPALRVALLQIEADTGMSPSEHRRWVANEANRT